MQSFLHSKKYRKANNQYYKSYELKQDSKHIIYLDTKNLHSYAMSKFIPTSGFKSTDPKEFESNKYSNRLIFNTLKNYMNYIMIIF